MGSGASPEPSKVYLDKAAGKNMRPTRIYKTEIRAERIHAGLGVAKANGVRLGRKPGDGKGVRIKVTPEQEAIVQRLSGENQGVSAIARATGLSSQRATRSSVRGQFLLLAEPAMMTAEPCFVMKNP